MANREVDQVTGTETTGHVWDDNLRELDNPLPSWWVWTFWVSIIWSIGYFVLYPSWPVGKDYTKGVLEWSSRGALHEQMKAVQTEMAPKLAKLEKASMSDIAGSQELSKFAEKAGKVVYGDNCAACHGTGANGVFAGSGYPNLIDNDWLWGGKIEDIIHTVNYGIRSGHDEERANDMPAYGKDGLLDAKQIKDAAGYVLSLSGGKLDGADVNAGKTVFAEQCAACHGEDARGLQEMGGPNLTDQTWLYGGSAEKVIETITNSRKGVMPAWKDRLTDAQIKAVSVYVHSRGGGQ